MQNNVIFFDANNTKVTEDWRCCTKEMLDKNYFQVNVCGQIYFYSGEEKEANAKILRKKQREVNLFYWESFC